MDLAKIKRNVGKMVDLGAPEADIDAYLSSEGTTPEALRAGKTVAPKAVQDEAASRRKFGSSFQRRALSSATLGFDDEIMATGESALNTVTGGYMGQPYDQALATQREIKRQDVEGSGGQGLSQLPAAVMGGILAVPGRTVQAATQGAAEAGRLTYNALGQNIVKSAPAAFGYGAAFGGAQAFGDGEDGFVNRLAQVPEAALYGGVGGVVLGSGLQAAIGGRQIAKQNSAIAANEKAQTAASMADDFRAFDVEPLGFAVSQSPTVRATAQGLANSVTGKPIRDRAAAASEGLTQRAQQLIRSQTDGLPSSDLGEEIQGSLRRNLTQRERSSSDFAAMPDEGIMRYTGPLTDDGFVPARPKIEPTAPRYVADIEPDLSQLGSQQPPAPFKPKQYRPDDVPLPPSLQSKGAELDARVETHNRNFAELQQLNGDVTALHEKLRDLPTSDPQWRYYAGLRRNKILKFNELQAKMPEGQKALDEKIAYDRDVAEYRQSYLPKFTADQNAVDARKVLDEAKLIEDQKRQQATTEARTRTEVQREQARLEAEALTRARQEAADRAYDEEIQLNDGGFKVGRTNSPYMDEFSAAYEMADRSTPRVQANPLLGPSQSKKAPDSTSSSLAQLIDSIATDARGALKLPGYVKGQPFDETGRIRPDVMAYLRSNVDGEVADMLQTLSDRRATGKLVSDNKGMRAVRTSVRRAAEDAERPIMPGETRTTDAAMMRRMYGALSSDMTRALNDAGPAGVRAARIQQAVDSEYARFMNDVRKPLAKIYGEKIAPIEAMDRLVKSVEKGDLKQVRAFMRVMREKDRPTRAAGAIVQHITNGAPDLPTFVKQFGKIPAEVRDAMFVGDSGRVFRSDLERLERLGKALDPYQRAARSGGGVDLSSSSNLALAASAVSSVYGSLVVAGGMAAASRFMASPKYVQWLTRYATRPKQVNSDGIISQLALSRLAAIAEQDGQHGEAVMEALSGTIRPTPAKATIIGPRAKNIDIEQYSKAQQLEKSGKSRDEIWNDTGWYKGKDGLWRFEIDDSTAAMKPNVFEDGQKAKGSNEIHEYRLKSVVDHPKLFEAYPKLANAKVKIADFGKVKFIDGIRMSTDDSGVQIGNNIYMNSAADWNDESFLGVLIHESQHLIQDEEKRPYGDGRRSSKAGDSDEKEYISRNGEYEAWNVQNRLALTQEQRKLSRPWESTMRDVTEDDVYTGQRKR